MELGSDVGGYAPVGIADTVAIPLPVPAGANTPEQELHTPSSFVIGTVTTTMRTSKASFCHLR